MGKAIIYYTIFDNEETPIDEKHILALPQILSKEILQYRKQDDINRLTAGKYLLKKILDDYCPQISLNNYSINEMGKPYINGLYDFNITHSGQVVACAILNTEGKIGIDVEKIRSIDIPKFTKQFTPPEMMRILADKNPQTKFFDFWSMKEAVMKADGRGMRIPLHSIRLKEGHATIDDNDNTWNLYPIELHSSVRSHVCSNTILEEVQLKKIELSELFS